MKKIQFNEACRTLSMCLMLVILVTGCKNKQASQVAQTGDPVSSEALKAADNPTKTADSQKTAQVKTESNEVKETESETSPKAEKASTLLVSFYSIGGGIDVKNAQSFDNFISAYKTERGKSIVYDRVPWGREGELDYCVSFADLNAEETKQFIDVSKEKIQDCKMVHFKINGECKRKR
jgi:hypothetical protein